jgi:hypothetical protein
VDRIGAVLLHARSLVPLVKARDFGMTPLLEISETGFPTLLFRAKWVPHACRVVCDKVGTLTSD